MRAGGEVAGRRRLKQDGRRDGAVEARVSHGTGRRRRSPILALSVILLWLASGAAPAKADEIALHPEVWAAFESYRAEHRPGAFAVSEDGVRYGQSLCRATRCNIFAEKNNALRDCRRDGGGACVVFATARDVRLAYRVMSARELAVCPLAPVPHVDVELVTTDSGTSHARRQAWLTALMKDDERQWLGDHGTVMGVTAHGSDFDYARVQYASVEGRDGIACAGIAGGTVRIRLEVAVYVASEIPAGSCLYREVLGHELEHRALALELNAQFARSLEAEINGALAAVPFVEVSSGTPWRQAAQAQLRALVAAAYDTFSREESRRQLGIDSAAEYERVSAACPGEADQYLP